MKLSKQLAVFTTLLTLALSTPIQLENGIKYRKENKITDEKWDLFAFIAVTVVIVLGIVAIIIWVKKKEKEERIQQEIHYRQVQVKVQQKPMTLIVFTKAAKEELRTIKRNQKRNALLDAARVASILDYY